jgi:hypothetical protein
MNNAQLDKLIDVIDNLASAITESNQNIAVQLCELDKSLIHTNEILTRTREAHEDALREQQKVNLFNKGVL